MKFTFSLIIILAMLAAAAPARACEPAAQAGPESDCVVLQFQNRTGVWFSLKKADALRKSWQEMPQLRLQLDKYTKLEAIREVQLSEYKQALAERKQVQKSLLQTNALLVRDARLAHEDAAAAHAWYRSPFLWAGVGVVVTAAVGATLVVAIH